MKKYLQLLRVKHYLKNALILFPLVFGGRLFDGKEFVCAMLGFFAFSFAASIVYIVNDIRDIERDRLHPTKKHRPLASGAVTIRQAWSAVWVLAVAVIVINWNISVGEDRLLSYGILVLYIGLNIFYSFGGKNIVLVDITILALGYLLRLYYGARIAHIEVSTWMYLTVMSMAFFLGMGKRRNELQKLGDTSRKVLKNYNQSFLDKNMYMCLGASIIFYALWCESMVTAGQSKFLLWTVPVVILICMRYSLMIEQASDGDPIEVVLKDKMILVLVGIFVAMLGVILYVPRI